MQNQVEVFNPIMPDTLQAKLEMARVFVKSNFMLRELETLFFLTHPKFQLQTPDDL